MQSIIVIGAGEFGREVVTWAAQCIQGGAPWTIKGFLDDDPGRQRDAPGGLPVLGPLAGYVPASSDRFLCAIGTPAAKREVHETVTSRGGRFATMIHPTALVGRDVRIGDGTILCPYTQLSCDIEIGKLVTFGTFSNGGHDTRFGDFVQVSGSCEINGRAVVEEGAYLGSHSTILPGAKVGAYAYVGAGSVVLRRVKARAKVFGNPAITIGDA